MLCEGDPRRVAWFGARIHKYVVVQWDEFGNRRQEDPSTEKRQSVSTHGSGRLSSTDAHAGTCEWRSYCVVVLVRAEVSHEEEKIGRESGRLAGVSPMTQALSFR
ncbi:hypothetical protein CVT25_009265 [Psilocybe cyanescens]|uniref:Uncharacterized protein n=1 Tax=Psilocybe cyanescens TaxID=93625 RepID=A0A409XTV4_PSICY|nr:hypothetical protein CVT25_009265 [Psilocybe cyanescens]